MRKEWTEEELEQLEKDMLDRSRWTPLTKEQYKQFFKLNVKVMPSPSEDEGSKQGELSK